jgi:hypothetical membrane protein
MKKGTIAVALLLLGFACLYYQQAALIPLPKFMLDIGPAAFPKILAVLLGVLSLALLGIGLFGRDKRPLELPKLRAWLVMGLAVGYMYILDAAGFMAAGMIMLFLMMCLLRPDSRRRTWATIAAMSLAIPAILYFVFNSLLKVGLPRGWLETLL